MSILIDELEARKNAFILVADVIGAMANATNSAPNEVVKYLDAHDVDEHLTVFYMGDNYHFYQYNSFLVNVGNDANTTYFLKSDVIAFEPITKHGLFVDKTMSENLIHDVYGRTYDVNQHKKNREDDYLTLGETLDFLNYNTDVNTSSYDHVKLRDIARRKLITPCFYFDGYVGSFIGESDNRDHGFYTEVIAGYFTYRSLAEEICRYDDHMKLPNDGVMIYSILEKKTAKFVDYDDVFLFYDKPQGLKEAEKLKITHIEAEEIRFSKRALNSYIASLANVSQDDTSAQNDSELLAKLEKLRAENDDLNSRLSTARSTYKQHRNEIKALTEKNEQADSEKAELIKQLHNVRTELTSKSATIDNNKPLYVTPAINIMNAVIAEFWINYDPSNPAPKQSTITDWITNNFEDVSDALALNIDKVCRHTSARSGGKYKR